MIIKNNINIKIIGDSLAAGVGSSNIIETKNILYRDKLKKYYQIKSSNAWHNLLENYLNSNNIKCTINNYGAVGAFSYQVNKNLNKLVSKEDDLVIILVGINDRKRKNGLYELRVNLSNIIDKLKSMNKQIIVLTPNPSIKQNEYYKNRIYHTKDIVKVIKDVTEEKKVLLVDIYEYINLYLVKNNINLEDIIYGENSRNDGFHPSDTVQKIIFECIKKEIEVK